MKRVVAEAWRFVLAQPIMALVAVLATAHALFFAGAAAWVSTQAGAARDALAEGLVVTASLDPALDEAQIKAVLEQLATPADIAVVRVRTPKEERERLGEVLGPGLVDGLDDLALPMGVTVDLRLAPDTLDDATVTRLEATLAPMREITGVLSLPWDPTHARTLFAMAALVRWLGFVLGALALVVAVAVVSQLVRRRLVAGHDHRELAIAFGATARWIELPHYVGAGLIGAAGAAVAVLLALLVQGELVATTALVPGLHAANPIAGGPYVLWCLLAGLGTGLVGAWLALRATEV